MTSPRRLKVSDRIKDIVAAMLERRVKDPRLGFVTITDVRLTGDGQQASVFYTVLGDEKAREDSAAALRSATGLIRSEVGKQLGMRHTPSIEFFLDAVPETAREFEELLANDEATLPTRHRKLRVARPFESPGPVWEKQVLAWLTESSNLLDADVRAGLARFVPEYQPYQDPGAKVITLHPGASSRLSA